MKIEACKCLKYNELFGGGRVEIALYSTVLCPEKPYFSGQSLKLALKIALRIALKSAKKTHWEQI